MSPTPVISDTSKRIARNTVVLYVRMFVLILVGFYTSRVVLRDLGVTDYGIYSAVGGVVSLFAVLTTSLSASVSRFLTFGLGEGDLKRLNAVFSTSVTMQLMLSAQGDDDIPEAMRAVRLSAEDEALSPAEKKARAAQLRRLGFPVYVIDGKDMIGGVLNAVSAS